MIKDFWTTNKNPITMWSKEPKKQKTYIAKESIHYTTKALHKDEDYISSKKVSELLGIGAKMIKKLLIAKQVDFIVYRTKSQVFYKKKDIDKIEVEEKIKKEVPDIYISSTELKSILGVDTMQLFTLAQRNKWTKKKFSGNVSWYLKSQVLT